MKRDWFLLLIVPVYRSCGRAEDCLQELFFGDAAEVLRQVEGLQAFGKGLRPELEPVSASVISCMERVAMKSP